MCASAHMAHHPGTGVVCIYLESAIPTYASYVGYICGYMYIIHVAKLCN